MPASLTTVIDAGARYGVHPTWQKFGGSLRYFAFEPDPREAERLRQRERHPGVEILACALARDEGERDLRISRHRGCSSFLETDLESTWFARYRPGEGQVKRIVRVPTTSVDRFARRRGLHVDFLKVDVEGAELEVLEGAAGQISSTVLGIRVNVNFQPAYKGQPLFQDIHAYLAARQFFLVNLDYFGRGVPWYDLFRNPDPLLPDLERYGVLVATDGVWLKAPHQVQVQYGCEPETLACAVLKYAYFCLLNNAPDVGLDMLMRFVQERDGGAFTAAVTGSPLYTSLRRDCAIFLGRWRAYPDAQWDLARSTFKAIFGLDLEGGSAYWEFVQSL